MSTPCLSAADEQSLGLLADGVAGLLDRSSAGSGRSLDQKLQLLRRVETIRRQLATVDHALIGDLDATQVQSLGLPDTAALLVRELRVSPGEAKARVRAAADLGPRVGRDGEVLPPLFASVAAAQSDGTISAEHAAVIVRTYDGLADDVQRTQGDLLQHDLVAKANEVHPGELARIAARLATGLDPTYGLSDAEIDRRREASLVQRSDGMFALIGTLTPECGAALRPVFDALAAPRPNSDGIPDPRTPGQRTHDALHEMALMVLRTEQLPDCGGVTATILVTMTADQFESGAGYATTGHGDLVPTRRVLGLAIDSQIMPVLFDPNGAVMSYGRTRRLAPPGMRLALYARDGGCTFPDCDRPPQWTQAHHFQEWDRDVGETSIANMGLVCGFHHRSFGRTGWRGVMINGVPHWVPPASLDPTQTPRRNTRHHHARDAA